VLEGGPVHRAKNLLREMTAAWPQNQREGDRQEGRELFLCMAAWKKCLPGVFRESEVQGVPARTGGHDGAGRIEKKGKGQRKRKPAEKTRS